MSVCRHGPGTLCEHCADTGYKRGTAVLMALRGKNDPVDPRYWDTQEPQNREQDTLQRMKTR